MPPRTTSSCSTSGPRSTRSLHGTVWTTPSTVRRVLVDPHTLHLHLIEEWARHNGHTDLIREAIDGATGE